MDKTISFENRQAKFRSISSSKDLNSNNNEILYDLLELCNKANTLEKNLIDTKDIIETESKYMQINMNKLNQKMEDILLDNADLKRNDGYFNKYIYITDMYTDNTVDSKANIDILNSCITLPHLSSISKINIYDETLVLASPIKEFLSLIHI